MIKEFRNTCSMLKILVTYGLCLCVLAFLGYIALLFCAGLFVTILGILGML